MASLNRALAHNESENESEKPSASAVALLSGSESRVASTIKVIETKRLLVDSLTASQEELTLAIEAVGQSLAEDQGTLRSAMLGFLIIGRLAQGPVAPLQKTGADTDTLPAILIRDLLANPAIIPIVVRRGREAVRDAPESGFVRTRPATRVRAVSPRGVALSIAAEEPIEVSGVVVESAAAGCAILAEYEVLNLGFDAYVASGAYAVPVLAAVAGPWPPESPMTSTSATRIARAQFAFTGPADARKVVRVLLAHSRAALDYYQSGAAAAAVLAKVAAAATSAGDNIDSYAAALSPTGSSLLSHVVPVAKPIPTATQRREVPAVMRVLITRLAETQPLACGPDAWVFDLSPLNDLHRVGALHVYLSALTEGVDAPRVQDFLERAAIAFAKQTQLRALSQRSMLTTSRARQYVMIIEEKFGAARAHAVLNQLRSVSGSRGAPGGSLAAITDAVQVNSPDAVLAQLAKREREIVTAELDRRTQEWKAAAGNKCPHLRLARKLRVATTSDAAQAALRDLSQYFSMKVNMKAGDARKNARGKPPITDWIMCKVCSQRVICPHVRELIQLEGRRAAYEEIRTRLMKYAVRVGGQDQGDAHAYYCRVCSERLAEAEEEDRAAELLGRFGELDAGLRTKVWAIAVGAARHVQFPVPTDEKQFASVAASVIYPVLVAAEASGASSRRRAAVSKKDDSRDGHDGHDEIDPRTHLLAVLFVYAYILDLVRVTRGSRSHEVGFAGVKLGAKEGAYAEQMLQLVAAEHRGLISQIEDISAEYLRARFTECYRLVRGESPGALVTANPEEELATNTVTLDPVYRYAVTVAIVAGDLPPERPTAPAAAAREFEKILGSSPPAIVKQARVNAKDPALAPLYLRRTGMPVPEGGDLEFLTHDPRVNLYANLYEPAAGTAGKAAETALAATLHEGGAKAKAQPTVKFTRPPVEDALAMRAFFFEAYRLLARYSAKVASRAEFDRYMADLARSRRKEAGLLRRRDVRRAYPYYDFGFGRGQQWGPDVAVPVGIALVYDEQGRRHDWSKKVTYYFDPPPGKKGEAVADKASAQIVVKGGPEGMKAALAADTGLLPLGATLVDLGCPVCGARKTRAVAELDAAKVWRSVRAASEIDSFFVFYEARCPAGQLHAWKTSTGQASECTKCGLTSAVVHAVVNGRAAATAEARAYYDKHAAQFATDRVRVVPAVTEPAATHRASEGKVAITTPVKMTEYTVIVAAATLAGVPPAVIEAIGATEGRDWADIAEGKGAPAPPTSTSDPRIYAADAEVRFFLAEYSTLRNVAHMLKPSPVAVELLAEVPKHEWPGLPARLPDVGAGYRQQFAVVLRDETGAAALTFAIRSLCQMALTIAETDALGRAFAQKTLQRVLRNQKLLSKPGKFNWAIFETGDDSNADEDQAGDVGEDVLEELLRDDVEEAPEDPFSGENMDYDTSEDQPNNEPS